MAISASSFARVLLKHFPSGIPPSVLALSGGVDSMCLAFLLARHRRQYQPDMRLLAVTVDHNLRPESHEEAILVGKAARKMGLDHTIRTLLQQKSPASNIEEWARHKRLEQLVFAALAFAANDGSNELEHNAKHAKDTVNNVENVIHTSNDDNYDNISNNRDNNGDNTIDINTGLNDTNGIASHQIPDGPETFSGISPHIFLAHNQDEQLETLLYRLQNHSTLYGLNGIRPVTKTVQYLQFGLPVDLVRPLLDFSKKEIIDTCKENNIIWFEDPTNNDIKLTERNYLRHVIHDVIPLLLPMQPELECLTYDSLNATKEKINEFNEYVDSQVFRLQSKLIKQDRMVLNSRIDSLRVVLTYDELEDNSIEVLSRLLYFNIYPLSSSTHYHWKYVNLRRKLVPMVYKQFQDHKTALDSVTTSFKHCSLNVFFDVTFDDLSRSVVIQMDPQTPQSSSEWLMPREVRVDEWTLFDGRFWLKVNTKGHDEPDLDSVSVVVEAYNPKKHKKFFVAQYPLFEIEGGNVLLEPVITTREKEKILVHLPTRGYVHGDWSIECILKTNPLALRQE